MAKVPIRTVGVGANRRQSQAISDVAQNQWESEGQQTDLSLLDTSLESNVFETAVIQAQLDRTNAAYRNFLENADKENIPFEERTDFYEQVNHSRDILEAALHDKKRMRNPLTGYLSSLVHSFDLGRENFRLFGRLLAQGEDTAMAYQYASELAAYHEPTGTLDNLLQQTAANAVPIGMIVGGTMATGGAASALGASPAMASLIGNAFSFGAIGTMEGGGQYLRLRRERVSRETATVAATLGGVVMGGLEIGTGAILTRGMGLIPGMSKLTGHADRVARLNAFRRLDVSGGKAASLLEALSKKGLSQVEIDDALKVALGAHTTKIGAILEMARQGGTEAVTGGMEEVFQGIAEMTISELARNHEGLRSQLPRTEGGNIDYDAITKDLANQFLAGLVLEGGMSTAMIMQSAGSRMSTAEMIGTLSKQIQNGMGVVYYDANHNRITNPKLLNQLNSLLAANQLANETEVKPLEQWAAALDELGITAVAPQFMGKRTGDFLARWTLMELAARENSAKGELSDKSRKQVIDGAVKRALDKVVADPIQSLILEFGDIAVGEVTEDGMEVFIGGTRIQVVRATDLPKGRNAAFRKQANGRMDIGVSEKLWNQLSDRGLTKEQFIAINLNKLSTFPHEVMHAIVNNLPEDQQKTLFTLMYQDSDTTNQQHHEDLSADFVTYLQNKRFKPGTEAFLDAVARADVAMRGNKAAEWARKRAFFAESQKAIGSRKPVDTKMLTETGPVSKGFTIGRKVAAKGISRLSEAVKPKEGASGGVQPGSDVTAAENAIVPVSTAQTAGDQTTHDQLVEEYEKQGLDPGSITYFESKSLDIAGQRGSGQPIIRFKQKVQPRHAGSYRKGNMSIQEALQKAGFDKPSIQAIALFENPERDINRAIADAESELFKDIEIVEKPLSMRDKTGMEVDGSPAIPDNAYSGLTVKHGEGDYKEFYIVGTFPVPGQHGYMDHPNLLGWIRMRDYGSVFEVQELQSELFQKTGKEILKADPSQTDERALFSYSYPDINQKQLGLLQILADNDNWTPVFMSMIKQYAEAEGYSELRFATGETAAQVEGHGAVEEHLEYLKEKRADIIARLGEGKLPKEVNLDLFGGNVFTYKTLSHNIIRIIPKTNALYRKYYAEAVKDLSRPWARDDTSGKVRMSEEEGPTDIILHRTFPGHTEGDAWFESLDKWADSMRSDAIITPPSELRDVFTEKHKKWLTDFAQNLRLRQTDKQIKRLEEEGVNALSKVAKFYDTKVAKNAKKHGAVQTKDASGFTWTTIPLQNQWQGPYYQSSNELDDARMVQANVKAVMAGSKGDTTGLTVGEPTNVKRGSGFVIGDRPKPELHVSGPSTPEKKSFVPASSIPLGTNTSSVSKKTKSIRDRMEPMTKELAGYIKKNKGNDSPEAIKDAFYLLYDAYRRYDPKNPTRHVLRVPTPEQAELIMRHPQLRKLARDKNIAEHQAARKKIVRAATTKDADMRKGEDFIMRLLDRIVERVGQGVDPRDWTPEKQAALEAKINAAFKNTGKNNEKVQGRIAITEDEQVQAAMAGILNLQSLIDDIKTIFDEHNAKMRQQQTAINKKATLESEDASATEQYESNRQTDEHSLFLKTKKVNPSAGHIAIMKHAAQVSRSDMGAYIPVNRAVFEEVIRAIFSHYGLEATDADYDAYDPQAITDDLGDIKVGAHSRVLTELFGPAWPIVLKAAQILEARNLLPVDLRSVRDGILATKEILSEQRSRQSKSRAPLETRLVAASPAVRPQTDSKVAVNIGGKPTKISFTMTPRHIVQFFIDHGLPSDSSAVTRNDLSSDTADKHMEISTEALRDQVASAIGSDVNQEDLDFTTAQMQVVLSGDITAEQAAREVLRQYAELMTVKVDRATANQAKQGRAPGTFQVTTQKGKTITGPAAGQFFSERHTANVGINRKWGSKNPFEDWKTKDNYAVLGELLFNELSKHKAMEAVFESDAPEQIAKRNALAADPETVQNKLAALHDVMESVGLLTSPLGREAETKELFEAFQLVRESAFLQGLNIPMIQASKKPLNPKSASDWARFDKAVKDYLQNDPGGETLKLYLTQHREALAKVHDVFYESSGLSANELVGAVSMQQLKDLLNSQRDQQFLRLQLDVNDLTKTWLKIFDNAPPEKLRDVLAMMGRTIAQTPNEQGHTPYTSDQVAKLYSLAARFALEALNPPSDEFIEQNPGLATAESRLEAMEQGLTLALAKLGEVSNPTVAQKYQMEMLNHYQEVMPLVRQILDGEGDYGQAIKEFLITDYKSMTSNYWDNLKLSEVATGAEEKLWTPRMFTSDTTASEYAADEFSFHQLTGRLVGRKDELFANHLADGKLYSHEDLIMAFMAGTAQIINARANKLFIHHMVDSGVFKKNPTAGYVKLAANGHKYTTFRIDESATGITLESGIPELKQALDKVEHMEPVSRRHTGYDIVAVPEDVYAPSQMGRYINRISRRSALRESRFGSGLMATNAKLKMLKVAWGMFHRRAFLWSAMIAGPAPLGYEWSNPEHGFFEKLKKRFDYIGTREFGKEMMESRSLEAFALAHYGATAFRIQDFGAENLNYKTTFDKWLALQPKNAFTKAAKETLNRLAWWTDTIQTELFGQFGGLLKFATGIKELNRLMAENAEKIAAERAESEKNDRRADYLDAYLTAFPEKQSELEGLTQWYSKTEEDILRSVAGMMNADFGGLHTRRMGISEGGFDAARLAFLGPDWTLSNFITVSKLFKSNKGSGGAGAWTSGSELERAVYGHFWARVASRVGVLVFLTNMIMSGLDDETAVERLKKSVKYGRFKVLQADISPMMHLLGGDENVDHYWNAAGSFMDPLKWAFDPIRSVYHKSSAIAKPAVKLMTGTDYRHRRPVPIHQIGSRGLYDYKSFRRGPLGLSELPAYTIQELINIFPIQIQKLAQMGLGEENVLSGLIEATSGQDITQAYYK